MSKENTICSICQMPIERQSDLALSSPRPFNVEPLHVDCIPELERRSSTTKNSVFYVHRETALELVSRIFKPIGISAEIFIFITVSIAVAFPLLIFPDRMSDTPSLVARIAVYIFSVASLVVMPLKTKILDPLITFFVRIIFKLIYRRFFRGIPE